VAGTITTVIRALFQSQGADKVTQDINKVGKAGEEATRKQTRLGNESTNTGRAFSSQAAGLGGLVAAYAGAAATLFALQQGFSALRIASQSEQLFSGINQLSANIGESGPKILASITEITRGQISLASAAEKTNLALSSGFGGEQIDKLAGIATKASRVLGRDLEDSFTRLIRGTTKLEPELLDELGIFTRIEPAVQAYAAQIGKSESSLTNFERRQAFLNAVIEEGTRKFKSVNVTVPTAAESLNQLGARLQDLTTKFGLFLATAAIPLVNFFSQNITGAFGLFALLARTVIGKGLEVLRDKFDNAAESAKAFGERFSDLSRSSGASKAAIQQLAQVSGDLGNGFLGLKGEARKNAIALKELADNSKLTVQQTKEYAKALTVTRDTLQNTVVKHTALRDALAANSDEYKAKDKVVKNYTTQLNKTQATLDATNQSLKNTPSSAKFAEVAFANISRTIQGFGILLSGVVKSVNLVLLAIGAVSTVAGVLANIYGKESELSAFTESLGKFFKELLTGSETAKEFRVGLAGGVNYFFGELEKSNQKLRDIDKFQFKTKFLGVTINVTKNKEDLAKEAQDIVRQAIDGQNIGDKISNNLISSVSGGLITGLIGAIAGGFAGAKVGALFGTTFGPVGTAIGGVIGLAAGTALTASILSDGKAAEESINEAKRNLNVQDPTAEVMALAKAYDQVNQKQKQAGILGESQRLYFDAQKQLLTDLIKNKELLGALGYVASVTGISIDELFKNFNKSVIDVNKNLNTLVATINDLNVRGGRQVNISFFNVKQVEKDLDSIVQKIRPEIEKTNKAIGSIGNTPFRSALNSLPLTKNMAEVLLRDTQQRQSENSIRPEVAQREIAYYNDIIRLANQQEAILEDRVAKYKEYTNLLTKDNELIISANNLQNNLVGAVNLQVDLQAELNSGLLTREQISQRLFNINKLLGRAQSEILKEADQQREIVRLLQIADFLRSQELYDQAFTLAKQADSLRENLRLNKLNYLEAKKLGDEQTNQSKKQDAVLQTADLLRKTFQQELGFVEKLTFYFDKNFKLARSNEEIDSNRLEFLSDTVALTREALDTEELLRNRRVQFKDRQIPLIEVPLDEIDRLANEVDKNLRRSFNGVQVQLARLGRETNKVIAGLFGKTIIETQTLARQLEKQAIELQNKTTEAILQNQLQTIKDRLAAEQQRIAIYEKERGLLNELADANAKARDIDIERQKIAQTRNLLFAKDLASNELLGNFFTDQQKQQIEIKIAEADLRALEDTTRNQIDAIKRKSESDAKAIQEQIKSNEVQSKLRLDIIEQERKLNTSRLEGQRLAAIAELDIQKLKVNALIEESKILENHVEGIARVLLEDRIEREIGTSGSLVAMAERQGITATSEATNQELRQKILDKAKSEIENRLTFTRGSLDNSMKKIEELTAATNGLFGTQIAGVNATAVAATNREREQADADARELERKKLINAQVADNDIKTLQNRLQEARNSYERLTEIARLSNNVGIQIASDFVKNIRDNVGKALQDLGQAILEGTLTLKNFAIGARDLFIKILRDLGTSIFQRLVVAPIQDFLVKSLSEPIMKFFGIDVGSPVQENTQALRELTAAITGRATGGGPAPGQTGAAGVTSTNGPQTVGGMPTATNEAAQASQGFGDKLKDLGVNFQTVGTIAATTFAATLAATRDWKKAFIYTVVSALGTALTQIATKQLFSGAVGTIGSGMTGAGVGGFFSSIGNWFSGLNATPTGVGNIAPGVIGTGTAIGGPVKHMAAGGYAGLRDRVPALLEPGEFVIRRPAAMAIGGQTLNQMNATGQTAPGNVMVNVNNQGTSQEVVGTPKVSMNGRDMIVDIVVRDIQNNGPIRKTLRGM
jgi:hypothetical protein